MGRLGGKALDFSKTPVAILPVGAEKAGAEQVNQGSRKMQLLIVFRLLPDPRSFEASCKDYSYAILVRTRDFPQGSWAGALVLPIPEGFYASWFVLRFQEAKKMTSEESPKDCLPKSPKKSFYFLFHPNILIPVNYNAPGRAFFKQPQAIVLWGENSESL